MSRPLVLLGGGGTAHEAIDLVAARARAGSGERVIAILDDDPSRHGTVLDSVPVTGPLTSVRDFPAETSFVDTLGSPRNYLERPSRIEMLGIPVSRYATLVHPSAIISPAAQLGPGTLVFAFTVIGAGANLDAHVMALPGVVVSHDAHIGAWSLLATGAIISGGARVGRSCYIGAGALLIDGCRVGDGSMVGMGSVVVREVASGSVVAGNPARILRTRGRRS